ncbi:MAG: phosphoribosylamine--glycine ligase [Patescibacteria group bacterium]
MSKLKILIVGAGGGREHALGWKIAQSPREGRLFFARGNAGTAELGTNLDIKETEITKLIEFGKEKRINLVLVVSDDPLAAGAVDEFQSAGFRTWGPCKAAAELESSKAFAKNFMKRHGLPTAKFEVFTNYESTKKYLDTQKLPIVVKASGLALGKGVVICKTKEEAKKALENALVKKVFGEAGREVVIEEFLEGREISIHAFSDGRHYSIFPPAQDHKKIGEGNTGPNTGGMGTIAPLTVDMVRIEREIIAPTFAALREEGIEYKGVLYPGLILTKDGPKILEYNARFGDPETQTYMRLLETDLLDVVDACIDGKLDQLEIKWKKEFACTIVLASGGYPGAYEKGKEISGIEEAEKDSNVVIFHAGTKVVTKRNLLTNGGRVLGISVVGKTLQDALNTAYSAASKISFEGMQYRKDIGKY